MNFAMNDVLIREKHYHDMIVHSQDLFYRTDLEGYIVFINPAVERLSGYTAEECIGMKMAEQVYLHAEDRKALFEKLRNKGSVEHFVAELIRKDGSTWWASTNAHFYQDDSGTILGVEGITRDITELKETEAELARYRDHLEDLVDERTQELDQKNKDLKETQEQLIQASKMAALGELSTTLAHEMKQPLSVMFMALDLLVLDVEEGETENILPQLLMLQKALDRSSKIIKRMGIFGRKSRLDDRKKEDLNEVVSNALLLENKHLQYSDIELDLKLHENAVPILCDSVQIEQVLINLITNAQHSMEKSVTKKLGIKLFIEEERACIDVSDTGSGIEPKVLQEIFAPFFTTKQSGKGTGLGLSISRTLIQNHGGTLDCESTHGRGSTFHLRFPVVEEAHLLENS